MRLAAYTDHAIDWYASARLAARHIPPHGPILDVGRGAGAKARFIFGDCDRVIGLDTDPAEAARARGRISSVLRADGCRLPFAAGSFAAVASFHSIEHLDAATFLAEARRVLRTSGVLVVVTPNRRRPSALLSWLLRPFTRVRFPLNPDHVREFARSELERVLADAGFDLLWSGGILLGATVPFRGRFLRLGIPEPPRWLSGPVAMLAAVARKS